MTRALILLEATMATIALIGFAVTGNVNWTFPAVFAAAGALFIEITSYGLAGPANGGDARTANTKPAPNSIEVTRRSGARGP